MQQPSHTPALPHAQSAKPAEEENYARINPNTELDTECSVPPTLRQHYIICPCKWRLSTLAGFLRWKLDSPHPNKIIVFLSNVDSVEFHYTLMSRTRITRLSGQLTAEEKVEVCQGVVVPGPVEQGPDAP